MKKADSYTKSKIDDCYYFNNTFKNHDQESDMSLYKNNYIKESERLVSKGFYI